MNNEHPGVSFVWPFIIIVLLGLGGWIAYAWYAGEGAAPAAVGESSGEERSVGGELPVPAEGESAGETVAYSASGFSPATVTIQKGETVTWVSDGAPMWVGSDDHPSHTEYSGTSREEHCTAGSTSAFDQCAVGKTYSFTFDKVGTWSYHNHRASSHTGQVIVVE